MQSRRKYIFFDADDTLWENERYFRNAEKEFAKLFSKASEEEKVKYLLWQKQEDNIPIFSYGSKTYLIGMVDAAIEICGKDLSCELYSGVKKIITDLTFHPAVPFDGVEETLQKIVEKCPAGYSLAVATKGDLSEQMRKFRNSGLAEYFHHVEVMENKDEKNYLELAAKFDMEPEDFIMIGNSVKSDIAPVINIGGRAVHIPHDVTWVHEMMDMPESDRITEAENFQELPKILSDLGILAQ